MAENIYNWQFNCLPGSANQGAILMTRNDILRPPFTQDDFVWVAMEDVIGTADIRLTYNEKTNIYTLEKAIGHRNNDGSWIKDWYVVGTWERLSQEVADILRQLVYVEYRYDTTEPNTLKVIGIRKDMTQDIICNINFVSAEVLAEAVTTLDNKITAETTRATNKEDEIAEDLFDEVARATQRENELQEMIESATMNPGRAIEVTAEKVINVLIDNESIKTNNSNQLKADVFDDTAIVNNKGWSSAKISQELTGAMHYKGQVATYADLPTTGLSEGDLYNVVDTGDNYAWNGSTWDKMSGDYIAGAGIDITGKVIRATGVAFGIGAGLETTGSGENTILRAKLAQNGTVVVSENNAPVKIDNTSGKQYLHVPVGKGLITKIDDNNQIMVNIPSDSALGFTPDNKLDVKADKGIVVKNNKIQMNANFTIKDTPLGTDNSKLALYSDGKIGVDFNESPVILSGKLISDQILPVGINYLENVTIPEFKDYDIYRVEYAVENRATGRISIGGGNYYQKVEGNIDVVSIISLSVMSDGGKITSPAGLNAGLILLHNLNQNNNIIGRMSLWEASKWLTSTENWISSPSSNTHNMHIRIYGMRAR